ncbi:MAG: hypothetical protein U9N61_02230 [Euryarchaeota archaeon]|nr:hypothetical protein [Euryarchaeota archaeon]
MVFSYNVEEAIETLRYVKPTFFSFDIDIPKEDAVTVEGPYPIFDSIPSVEVTFRPTWNWSILLTNFDFGDSSRPGKIYYEIHVKGNPYEELTLPAPAAPVFRDGFYVNAFILVSNLRNSCTTFFVDDELTFKVWNSTGADPEDVYLEATFHYIAIPFEYLQSVYAPYTRDSSTLSDLVLLGQTQLAMEMGQLGAQNAIKTLDEIEKRTKKREVELGIGT